MRKRDRLQKFLYLVMMALGTYLLYQTGNLLLDSWMMEHVLETGKLQQSLEDAAARTWAAGYTASVDEYDGENGRAVWMEQIAPVYSFLAESLEEKMTDGAPDGTEAGSEAGETDASEADEYGTDRAPDDAAAVSVTEAGSAAEAADSEEPAVKASGDIVSAELLEQIGDFDQLLSNYYIVNSNTAADADLLNAAALLSEDLSMEQNPDVPQILIYHTHSQEAFADSAEGQEADTVVGVGEYLAELLRSEYGYQVLHDTGTYDLVNGILDRSAAYEYARTAVRQILEDNPTIEVVIDLHRDGVDGEKFVTEIDGRPTARIMLFNGISRDREDEPQYWLSNPYIAQNLAFSLQLQLKAQEQYPGFTRKIYLNAGRYNLDLCPRSLLIEAGTQLNTVEEEKNAMIPLAKLLHQVLSGS